MFLIQNPTIVSALGSLHSDAQDRVFKSPRIRSIGVKLQQSRSIGDLVSLVRDPLGIVSYDGGYCSMLSRAKENLQREDSKQKRHILYLRLQEVRRLPQ